MAETDEILVSLVIFFFILLLFYIKFGKKIAAGEKFKEAKEKIFGKVKSKVKKPKFSWGSFLVIAVLVLVVGIIVWDFTHTTTYSFTEKEFNKYWTLESGTVTFDKGYMQTSAGTRISLKNSEDMDPTRIDLVPADKQLNDVTVGIGTVRFRYFFGEPPDTNYAWDKGHEYHIGEVRNGASKESTFLSNQGKLHTDDRVRTLSIRRGSIIGPNYRMFALGEWPERIVLTTTRYDSDSGKGTLTVTFSNSQAIKSLKVTEGLLAKI